MSEEISCLITYTVEKDAEGGNSENRDYEEKTLNLRLTEEEINMEEEEGCQDISIKKEISFSEPDVVLHEDDESMAVANNMNTNSRLKCKLCNLELGDENSLIEHLYVHAKTRSNGPPSSTRPRALGGLKCKECGYETSTGQNMIRHSLIHTGEKPFQCAKCSYASRTKQNLRRHESVIHDGARNFPCKLCEYCGTTLQNLTRHAAKKHKDPSRVLSN